MALSHKEMLASRPFTVHHNVQKLNTVSRFLDKHSDGQEPTYLPDRRVPKSHGKQNSHKKMPLNEDQQKEDSKLVLLF